MRLKTKQFIKLFLLFFGMSLMMIGSFVAGMIFHANLYTPVQSTSSLTTNLPLFAATGADIQQAPAIPVADTPAELATFWEAWSFLNEQFYGEIPPDDERIYGAIRGMVASFDDQHTSFIDPVRAAIMSENMRGSFEGIGATIRLDDAGRLVIVDLMPEQPAFRSGLRPEDVVLEVDGQSIEGLSLHEAVLLIRGPANSTVVLTVVREDEAEPIDIPIRRAKIELEVVEAKMLETPTGSEKIGYIRLTQFSNGAADKLAEAIEDLFDQGASSLIFDLRSNPGGLLSEAVDVSSLFVEKNKTVVIERLKGGEEKMFTSKQNRPLSLDIPMVILVNEGSASASEIVAGAMQDLKRAKVIGEQTFGKGSVQLPHNLSDGSELRVTIAEWLTPARRQIHGKGIAPDIVVEMSFEDIEKGVDPQLEEAIKFLNRNE
jgi:carboxyl-terminal processing protease